MRRDTSLLLMTLGLCLVLLVGYSLYRSLPDRLPWIRSYEQALQQARLEDKPILAYLFTDWCGYCKKMEAETFTDEAVIDEMSDNYVWLKLNAETDEEGRRLQERFNITGYPGLLLLDGAGQEMGRISGFVPAGAFRERVAAAAGGPDSFSSLLRTAGREPGSVGTQYRLAEKYIERGDFSAAIERLRRVVELDPENDAGMTDLSYYYLAPEPGFPGERGTGAPGTRFPGFQLPAERLHRRQRLPEGPDPLPLGEPGPGAQGPRRIRAGLSGARPRLQGPRHTGGKRSPVGAPLVAPSSRTWPPRRLPEDSALQQVSQLFLLGPEVFLRNRRGLHHQGNALHDLEPFGLQAPNLVGVVGHETNPGNPQPEKRQRAEAVGAQVRLETQPGVGLHRVGSLILVLICVKLVDEADSPAFLKLIEEDAATGLGDLLKSLFQLLPAIATERVEDVAGHALRVDPHQGGPPVTQRPAHQRHQLLVVFFALEPVDPERSETRGQGRIGHRIETRQDLSHGLIVSLSRVSG